ncbi:MAG: lysozyme [Pseudorhodoplanes sp.]|nr:lysozyme [Pseudorhodoplanes sp.]
MSRMRTGAAFAAAAIALIGSFEGLRLAAYRDPVGIVTACYGETQYVRLGMTFTKEECDLQLVRSLVAHEDGMLRCLRVRLPPRVHLAMLSLTYNIGVGAFCRSSLPGKLNAGDFAAACDTLPEFSRAGGSVLAGLLVRRESEREICRMDLEPSR